MILTADRIATGERMIAPGWLRVRQGSIVEVGGGAPPEPADIGLTGTVVPGFVDIHVHGGGGASFDEGTAEAAERVLDAHLAHGTTTMIASLVTMAPSSLDATIRELSGLVDDRRLGGIHLEGPWLSPLHRGAHERSLLDVPRPERVEELLELAGPRLRMVTLAPELEGGVDAVRRLADAGVVAAVGHSDASYEVTCAALQAGARMGTHLFNAMRGIRHRDPGPVPALLEHPDTHIELIADGVHLHPAIIRLAASAKPKDTVLVTDAMAAAAAADGEYRLGSLEVQVHHGEARLADGTIAGSTLTLARAVRYAVLTVGLPFERVIRSVTSVPAALLGLDDVGRLEAGRRADLVVLDEELRVRRVMKNGSWLAGS